ncbi:hypothetical protein [Aquabacterium sp.]|uniref:hypothetical protein n=1 Tax=Aquabacterium sp. TaxID=1872578 RepID=UPI0035B31FE7
MDAQTRNGSRWKIEPSSGSYSTGQIQSIRHNFDQHPLMQLPELAKLAKDLVKTRQCRFITPGSDQSSPFFHTQADHHGRDIDEVFARIEEPGSWVALYNVETHPIYKGFLDDVVGCFRHLVEPILAGPAQIPDHACADRDPQDLQRLQAQAGFLSSRFRVDGRKPPLNGEFGEERAARCMTARRRRPRLIRHLAARQNQLD